MPGNSMKNLVSAKSCVLRGINFDTLVLIRLQSQHLTNFWGHQFGAPGSSTSIWFELYLNKKRAAIKVWLYKLLP